MKYCKLIAIYYDSLYMSDIYDTEKIKKNDISESV